MKTRIMISSAIIVLVFFTAFFSFFFAPEISFFLTGKTTTTRAFILESHPINCSVNLTKGLNMVSFPCELGVLPFELALSDKENQTLDFEFVFLFDYRNPQRPWASYNPSLPNWTVQQKPATLDRRTGYFIYVNESSTYHAEGLRFSITSTQLRKGWNLVGYSSTNIKSVEEVLSSINNHYVSVHSYQDVDGVKKWLYHVKGQGGTLEYFKPGYAYWIEMERNAVWRVEW